VLMAVMVMIVGMIVVKMQRSLLFTPRAPQHPQRHCVCFGVQVVPT